MDPIRLAVSCESRARRTRYLVEKYWSILRSEPNTLLMKLIMEGNHEELTNIIKLRQSMLDQKITELRRLASKHGIPYYSEMSKSEIVFLIARKIDEERRHSESDRGNDQES